MSRGPIAVATQLLARRPDRVRLLRRGINDHWIVTSGPDRFVLRRFGSLQDLSSTAWEQDMIAHLAERGWTVPQTVAGPAEVDGAIWLVMRRLDGRPMRPNRRTSFARGVALALLHRDLDGLDAGQRPGWSRHDEGAVALQDVIAELPTALRERVPEHADELLSRFREVAVRTVDRLAARGVAGWKSSPIHSDFMPWNILVQGQVISGVLDFEKSHVDLQLTDLAFATWGGKYETEVVAGYRSVAPDQAVSPEDLELLWRAACLAAVEHHLRLRLRGIPSGGLGWGVLNAIRPWGEE